MIDRYTRRELGELWSDHARFEAIRRVEVAACEEMDGPTQADLEAIRAATFTVEAVNERERVTDHDTAAFVDVLSASAGEPGRWIHYGLTSSDVVDTGMALQIKAVGELILPESRALVEVLAAKARAHRHTLCAGRTHGVHAEPTTFGIKMAGLAFEAHRNFGEVAVRLKRKTCELDPEGGRLGVDAVGATGAERVLGAHAPWPPAPQPARGTRAGSARRPP